MLNSGEPEFSGIPLGKAGAHLSEIAGTSPAMTKRKLVMMQKKAIDEIGIAEISPGMPRDDAGPVFREPWEAQAFAITLALQERGLFTAAEWSAALGAEIKRAQAAGDPDTGETYYRHWMAALERLIAEKGVADRASLHRYRDAWDRAADRTPHGQPIELRPDDFAT